MVLRRKSSVARISAVLAVAVLSSAATVLGAPPAAAPVELPATAAKLHGEPIRVSPEHNVISRWHRTENAAEWPVPANHGGWHEVVIDYACPPECGGSYEVVVGRRKLSAAVRSTGSWLKYEAVSVGKVQLPAEATTLRINATRIRTALMNIRSVRLVPTTPPGANDVVAVELPAPPVAKPPVARPVERPPVAGRNNAPAAEKPAGVAAALVGTWQSGEPPILQIVTFSADGTFTSIMKFPGQERSMSGNWTLDGKSLTQKVTRCENPAMIGRSHTVTVKEAAGNRLVVIDPDKGEDRPVEMTRVVEKK